MNISDSVLRAFARGDFKADAVVATLPAEQPVKGIDRPWVVRTERELTVEERLAALEERLATIEARGQ